MASPAVQTTAESATTTAGTTHTVNVPSSVAAGETLLAVMGLATATSGTGWPSGWVELFDTGPGATYSYAVAYKKADGTESGTISVTSTGSARSATIMWRVSGAADPATNAPEGNGTEHTATDPDSLSLSPTGGSKDYLWFSLFVQAGEEADDDTWVTSAPTNYSGLLQKTCGTTGAASANVSTGGSWRQLTSATEDPGAYVLAQHLNCASFTIAIHPGAAAGVAGTTVTNHLPFIPRGRNI